MATISAERIPAPTNPLDILEELVDANEWPFDRLTEVEMLVEMSGRWCDYRMFVAWQEDLSAVYFACRMDMRVPARKRPEATELLALVNERLWLGHFDLCSEEAAPVFRHTVLLRGLGGASVEQLEDLMDIALTECERFYPAFQLILWGGRSPREAMDAAVIDTAGEA
jgi:hypothetical protein